MITVKTKRRIYQLFTTIVSLDYVDKLIFLTKSVYHSHLMRCSLFSMLIESCSNKARLLSLVKIIQPTQCQSQPQSYTVLSSLVPCFSLKFQHNFNLKNRFIDANYLSVCFKNRSRLLLSIILLTLSPLSYAVLSAKTANTIQGSAPLFVTSGPNAIDLTDFKYFGVRYKQIDYYVPSQLGAALDADGYNLTVTTPADLIDLFNTTGVTSPLTLALGTPSSAEIIDEDGDGIYPAPLAELTTGSVTMRWYQGIGAGKPLTGPEMGQSFCDLAAAGKPPYLKITGGVELRTLYGDPASQAYPDVTVGLTTPPVRNFRILINGGTCGALADYNFFPVQPTGSDNFPTTGAEGLYFDLIIAGVNANTLTWPASITHGNVTATIEPLVTGPVRVTLTGPNVQKDANNLPISAVTQSAFNGPANFIIEGKEGTTTVVSYPFTIKKWYVNSGDYKNVWSSQKRWCQGLYGSFFDLASVGELTNATNSKVGIVGTSPSNSYQRAIGGGLFSEWGRMYNYRNAGFVEYQGTYSVAYHANEWLNYDYTGNNPVNINKTGSINTMSGSHPQLTVCVSKP